MANPSRTSLRAVPALLALTLTASAAQNPKVHKQGLVGEAPTIADDTNWPWPAAPEGNPFPHDWEDPDAVAYRDAKARLGKLLFWDEQVSMDNTMACGTCHFPSAGGADARPAQKHPVTKNLASTGVHAQSAGDGGVVYGSPATTGTAPLGTERAAPTMIGAYAFDRLFWDRSAGPAFTTEAGEVLPGFEDFAALEALAVRPPVNEVEMGIHDLAWSDGLLVAKLDAARPLALVDPATVPGDVAPWVQEAPSYGALFDRVFAGDPSSFVSAPRGVTRERFALSIATYLRTLVPDRAPVDTVGLSGDALAGFKIVNQSGCFTCHSTKTVPGPFVTVQLQLTEEGKIQGAFNQPMSSGFTSKVVGENVKVPTLRNVALRSRFFHTGKVPGHPNDLEGLVDFYDTFEGLANQNLLLSDLLNDTERAQVLAFLDALTDPRVRDELPPFDRPELASERLGMLGEPAGNQFGSATPAGGAEAPVMLANAPPHVPHAGGLSHFRLGLGGAEPGGAAVLGISRTRTSGPEVWIGPVAAAHRATVDGAGFATVAAPIPAEPALVGTTLYAQWEVSAAGGVARTRAAALPLFGF